MILAIFDLQVVPILITKFPSNWPFRSGEEVQNRRPAWISDQNNFFTLKLPQYFSPNLLSGAGGVVFKSKLLTPHDRQCTTDIDQPQ